MDVYRLSATYIGFRRYALNAKYIPYTGDICVLKRKIKHHILPIVGELE